MRKEFEMTDEERAELLDACKPVPCMFLSGGRLMGSSPQENANAGWRRLGKKLGFKPMTVQSVSGKSDKFFTAEAAVAAGGET